MPDARVLKAGETLSFGDPERPWSLTDDAAALVWDGVAASGRFRLPTVSDLVVAEVLAALAVDQAEVLCFEPAPDGRRGVGPIDAIVPGGAGYATRLADGRAWTTETVAVANTRGTVVRIRLSVGGTAAELQARLDAAPRIHVPPAWAEVRDTAAASELMVELGEELRPGAVVLFGASQDAGPDASGACRRTLWLAAPEALLLHRVRALFGRPAAAAASGGAPGFGTRRSPRPVRVGVVALGTIGRRIAEAVGKQPDMTLAGVAVQRPIASLLPLLRAGVPVYGLDDLAVFGRADVPVAGALTDLLQRVDVIVDCGPRGSAATRSSTYRAQGVTAIYQGGETAAVADADFCATVNFEAVCALTSVRVASCNSTGLLRLLGALRRIGALREARATLMRCGADPDKARKGSPNALVAEMGVSHHARDVLRLMPDVRLRTLAAYAPTNRAHLLQLFAAFEAPVSTEAVLVALSRAPRVLTLSGGEGATSDLRRYLGRGPRADCYSIAVWRDGVSAEGAEVSLSAAIPMEAIVVPDTIDAIRALCIEGCTAEASRALTDTTLDVLSGEVRALRAEAAP